MKLLGIDYGKKNIGIAISNEEKTFAFPHSVIKNNRKALKKISKIVKEENIKEIVLGRSVNLKGELNPIMEDIKKFKMDLIEETAITILYEDEHFSTLEAKQIQGNHEKIDSSAAALILKSYLEKNK